MPRTADLLNRLRGGLIVSVQPVIGGPMDRDDIVTAMAEAAVAGGAVGLRIEGATRVANVRSALPDVPIVGIVKRDLEDSDVRITPLPQDVDSLI
ncbi:MAG: N-acetylmannosamine-6-phosphate 2-epimerase, partial [bacterium]|nr:N-acetylmannosamine-6-phosphate 2-epimerase [bacterium]